MAHGPATVEGERKPVTALFADVVGSTSLAGSLDPEEWAGVLNQLYKVLTATVVRFGGTVTQLSGDAVVALFGAPVAHEDDPERAIRAALEMILAVTSLSDEVQDDIGAVLQVRIGINSGLAVVGHVGASGHEEFTALGDAINVAARIQTAASPGTVLVTEATYLRVAKIVDAIPVGPLAVKGKSEPIDAYEIVDIRRGGRPRGIAGLTSPMIGREADLDRLRTALAALRAGRGRVALVLGEPGIGKSRLVTELRTEGSDVRWIEGRCLSYGQTLAHHLVADLISSMTGASSNVAPASVLALTGELLGARGEEVGGWLLHLAGAPVPAAVRDRLGQLDPAAVRRHHVAALKEILAAMAEAEPIGIVCEDLHWADAASTDVLVELASNLDTDPVLLVATSRQDRDSEGWRFVTQARIDVGEALTEVQLAALPPDDSRTLVANLLEIESLPADVRALILERTDGNPFFIEEVVRSLIDRALIVRRGGRWVATDELVELDIPETVHGLLLARIDRLPDEARRCLQVASVLGRTFPTGVLESLVDGTIAIARCLGVVEAHGLVRIQSTAPELTYTFRHALIQEAAYHGLLRRERRELHRRAAEVLEGGYEEHGEELAGLLAHHLDLAGESDRAVPYLLMAGRQALTRYANREAHQLFERVRRRLAGHDDERSLRHRLEARLGEAEAGQRFVPGLTQLELLEEGIAEAELLADERLQARVHLWLGLTRISLGDHADPATIGSLTRALEVGERLGDDTLIARPLAFIATSRYEGGQFRDAIPDLERAVEILARQERLAEAADHAGTIAASFARLGEFAEADHWQARSVELAEASGDPNALLHTDLVRGILETERGNLEVALMHTARAVERANDVGNIECALVGNFLLGDQHLRRGDVQLAIDALEQSTALAAYCDVASFATLGQAWLAAARGRAGGDVASEVAELTRSLEDARSQGTPLGEAEILRHRASLCATEPEPSWDEVVSDLESAISILEQLQARPALVRTLVDQAAVLELVGRPSEAAEVLHRIEQLSRDTEPVEVSRGQASPS